MANSSWNKFVEAKDRFRRVTEDLSASLPGLKNIQQKFADSRGNCGRIGSCESCTNKTCNRSGNNSVYKVETPVVYNTALDDITVNDEIKLILVADNPGRREQAAENRRYLVGPSGKIAAKFFRDNPSLEIDFDKNVIILNKTPIHSPRTIELRELCRLMPALAPALEKSQKVMAELLLEFHKSLGAPIWITGYSEMKKGGLFETYTETVKNLFAANEKTYKQLFVFRHFSMNQFTIDLKQQALPGESVSESLLRIGLAYRERVLG